MCRHSIWFSALLSLSSLSPGCAGDTHKPVVRDAGTQTKDAAADKNDNDASSVESCVSNPQTHEELINACTDSEFVDKQPNLPLLLPDGGLPPLP